MRHVAMAVAACALLLGGCSGEEAPAADASASNAVASGGESGSAAASASAPPASGSPLPGEETSGPLEDREPTETEAPGKVGAEEVPAKKPGDAVAVEPGVKVRVTRDSPVTIEAVGPGEVSGPGRAVRVEMANDTADSIDLGGVAVSLEVGGEPASESYSPPADPFMGQLKPGSRASATYVFLLPEGASGQAVLRVEYSGSDRAVVVRL